MFAPEVLGPAVNRLAALAGSGRALEFAIGTGRVAIPLSERGVRVTGIELSTPMIDRLRTKADEATMPVFAGDMATVVAPGEYSLVYLVFNTIANLLTQAEQVAWALKAADASLRDAIAAQEKLPEDQRQGDPRADLSVIMAYLRDLVTEQMASAITKLAFPVH